MINKVIIFTKGVHGMPYVIEILHRYTTFCSIVQSIRNEWQISMPKIIEKFKISDKLKKKNTPGLCYSESFG